MQRSRRAGFADVLQEKYQGLNLPDLMALMHDIVRPDPVSLLPVTTGWWILFGWLAFCLVLFGMLLWRKWLANRYRREALALMDSILAKEDGTVAAREAAILVKRTALAVFPRSHVAALTGEQWAEFLCRTSRQDATVVRGARDLVAAPYRSEVDDVLALAAARAWLKVHRA